MVNNTSWALHLLQLVPTINELVNAFSCHHYEQRVINHIEPNTILISPTLYTNVRSNMLESQFAIFCMAIIGETLGNL